MSFGHFILSQMLHPFSYFLFFFFSQFISINGNQFRQLEPISGAASLNLQLMNPSIPVILNGITESKFGVNPSYSVDGNILSNEFSYTIVGIGSGSVSLDHANVESKVNGNNSVIDPLIQTSVPTLKDGVYSGNILILWSCTREGKAVVSVKLVFNFGQSSKTYEFGMEKLCNKESDLSFNLYIRNISPETRMFHDGYLSSRFSPVNPNPYVDDSGSVTFLIVETLGLDAVECELDGSDSIDDEVVVYLDNHNEKDYLGNPAQFHAIEIIFSGKAKRVSVRIVCYVGDRVTPTISFDKLFHYGPANGFDVIVDPFSFSTQYAIINDGEVTPPFRFDAKEYVTVPEQKNCFLMHLRSRNGLTNFTKISVESSGIATTLMGDAADINGVSSESEKLAICHRCEATNSYVIKVYITILKTADDQKPPPRLEFVYQKKCRVGTFKINITPGLYNPDQTTSYIVKDGIVQPGYEPGLHLIKARADETTTKFYLSSSVPYKIFYPNLNSVEDDIKILPELQVFGYDRYDTQEMELKLETGAKVLEVTYNCRRSGEYHITIEVRTVDSKDVVSFGWLKQCQVNRYSFSVRSRFFQSPEEGNPNEDMDYDGDIVSDGRVVDENLQVEDYEAETRWYFAAGPDKKMNILEKPRVSVHNPKICTVKLSGDVLSATQLTDASSELVFTFNCLKGGSTLVDVVFTIGASGVATTPTQVSFYKECPSPEELNLHFIKNLVIILACIAILFLLYPYVLACFPDVRFLRPWSYFSRYTRISNKSN